tara:strand:+ start:14147 stop:15088 length:942 start_codon:yes stop_codon:yes gene_type:complete
MCGLVAVGAYLIFKPVVYEATVSLSLPQKNQIQALRFPMLIAQQGIPRSRSVMHVTYWMPSLPKLPEIDVYHVFEAFRSKLTSPGLQQRYVQEHVIPAEFYVSSNAETLITLIVYSDQSDQAMEWVKGFSRHASQMTIQELASNIQHVITNRLTLLEHAITSIRKLDDQYKLDRLEQLKEALHIARKLNIVDRIVETPLRPEDVPLFYRGANMLSAEIEAVQQRATTDSFASHHIRQLQLTRDNLRSVSINTDGVQAASFNEPSVRRVKTNNTRLIVLGVLFGLVIGITIAFFGVVTEWSRNVLTDKKSVSVP